MKRRAFFGLIGLTPPAIAMDKRGCWEWIKRCFVPGEPVDEQPDFELSDWISPEVHRQLLQNTSMANEFCFDYEREFHREFPLSQWSPEEIQSRKDAGLTTLQP